MTSGVGVHLVTLLGVQILRRLEQSSAEGCCRFMCSMWIIDVKIEMDLLRCTVGPLGRGKIRRELYTHSPLAGGVDDAVPRCVLEDPPIEHSGPERALGA